MLKYIYVMIIAVLMPVAAMAADWVDQVSNAGGRATFGHAVSSLTGAQIEAAKGSSTVSLKASKTSSYTSPSNNENPGIANFSVWSLMVSAPLNKNSDDTDIANLDGMVNAERIEIKYSRFRMPGRRYPEKALAICERVRAEMEKQKQKPSSESGCDSEEVEKYGSAADKSDFKNDFWDIKNTNRLIWGANAKLGYQKFDFIDVSSISRHTQEEYPWAVGGFIAFNPDAWRAIFTLNAQYQDAFKDSTTGTVCPAGGSSKPLICMSGPIRSPKETKKKLLSLEARRDFGFAGVGLTATYDFEEKIYGVELPVYFVPDKDGKFNAGIKAGWRNDSHDFTASIFVGSTFDLFKW